MRPTLALSLWSAVLAAAPVASAFAQSAEAQVIFSNGPLTVIGADGQRRTVVQGEHLRDGDRLITPPGTLGQLKLPDGSLVSARPESEVRLDRMGPGADRTVLELGQGSVRVINVAPPSGAAPRPVDIVTPASTMQLTRGDGEAFHVRPPAAGTPGTPGAPGARADAGTYNRLQAGEAIVRTQRGDMPLQGQQISFSPRADALPTPVAALPADVARNAPPMPGAAQPPRGTPPAAPGAPAEAGRPAGAPAGQDQGLALSGTTSLLTERSLFGPPAGQGSGAGTDAAQGTGAAPGAGPGAGQATGPGAGPGAGAGTGPGTGAPGTGPGAQQGPGAGPGQAAVQPGSGPLTGVGQRPLVVPMPGGIATPRPQPPAPPPPRIVKPVTPPGNTGQPGTRPPGTVLPPR